jgi:hypothetical protein
MQKEEDAADFAIPFHILWITVYRAQESLALGRPIVKSIFLAK